MMCNLTACRDGSNLCHVKHLRKLNPVILQPETAAIKMEFGSGIIRLKLPPPQDSSRPAWHRVCGLLCGCLGRTLRTLRGPCGRVAGWLVSELSRRISITWRKRDARCSSPGYPAPAKHKRTRQQRASLKFHKRHNTRLESAIMMFGSFISLPVANNSSFHSQGLTRAIAQVRLSHL